MRNTVTEVCMISSGNFTKRSPKSEREAVEGYPADVIFEVDFEGLVKSTRQKNAQVPMSRGVKVLIWAVASRVMGTECKGKGCSRNNSEMLAEAVHGGLDAGFQGLTRDKAAEDS